MFRVGGWVGQSAWSRKQSCGETVNKGAGHSSGTSQYGKRRQVTEQVSLLSFCLPPRRVNHKLSCNTGRSDCKVTPLLCILNRTTLVYLFRLWGVIPPS